MDKDIKEILIKDHGWKVEGGWQLCPLCNVTGVNRVDAVTSSLECPHCHGARLINITTGFPLKLE